jgi:hypothetical protein
MLVAIVLASSADTALYAFAHRERPQQRGGCCFGVSVSEREQREIQTKRDALRILVITVNGGALACICATFARLRRDREKRPSTEITVRRQRPFLVSVFGTLIAFSTVSLTVWLGHYHRRPGTPHSEGTVFWEPICPGLPFVWVTLLPASDKPEPAERDPVRPAIAAKPPYPKALVEGAIFDLGAVPGGELKSHFVCIRNVGDAPLILRKLGWQQELEVGKSLDYEIAFKVPDCGGLFAQGDFLFTNDPQRREIRMAVVGSIAEPRAP